MKYTGEHTIPDAQDICDEAEELEDEFKEQRTEDELVRKSLSRTDLVDVQKPDEDGGAHIKKIVSGYKALIVEQDFSFLTTPPFMRINPLTPEQETHAEMLETALVGMYQLSQGQRDVWLEQVYDFVWAGRGWSVICPVPEMWSEGYSPKEGEEGKAYLDRIAQQKEDDFPIIWKSVPVENTWPTYDMRGNLKKVFGIRKMKVRDIRTHYGEHLCPGSASHEEKKVIEYADLHWMCTVLEDAEYKAEIIHAWHHNMGVNPHILAEAPRSAPVAAGERWQGALYHTRELLTELDSLISDIRYNIKRAIRAQLVAQLDLEGRRAQDSSGRGKSEILDIKPTKTITIDKDEKIYELEPARTNVDAYRLIEIIQGLTKEVAVRSVLLGILGSGGQESGILYNTAAQFAQKQYGPAVSQLQRAAVSVGQGFFASVRAFCEDEDDEIPILYSSADGEIVRVSLKAKDVEGWGRAALQARIDLAIPINESANITNAKLVTDPNNPLMSYTTAAARYLSIENPLEEYKLIVRDEIRRAVKPMIAQVVSESGLHLLAESEGQDEELAGMFAGLPDTVQQAIAAHAAQTGQLVPQGGAALQGGINRSAANHMKANRFQNTSAVSDQSSTPQGGY